MIEKIVVVVDDDDDDQELFANTLEMLNIPSNHIPFTEPALALEKLIGKEIVPDIIFLDYNMPKLNGKEFLSVIKSEPHLQHIPVIMLSTSSNPQTIEELLQAGAMNFFTKPSRLEELKKIIASSLALV